MLRSFFFCETCRTLQPHVFFRYVQQKQDETIIAEISSVISGYGIIIIRRRNNNNTNVSLKPYSAATACAGIYQLCCVMQSATPSSTADRAQAYRRGS